MACARPGLSVDTLYRIAARKCSMDGYVSDAVTGSLIIKGVPGEMYLRAYLSSIFSLSSAGDS